MTAPLLRPETPADRPGADALVEAAFGPGRLAKTAERLREAASAGPVLSIVADGERGLCGVVRLWSIRIGETRALFLGPIAVDRAIRSQGLGRALMTRACEDAAAAGWPLILLVGEPAWFSRSGFSGEQTAQVQLPGPVDQGRVLVRALVPGADQNLSGLVRAAGA